MNHRLDWIYQMFGKKYISQNISYLTLVKSLLPFEQHFLSCVSIWKCCHMKISSATFTLQRKRSITRMTLQRKKNFLVWKHSFKIDSLGSSSWQKRCLEEVQTLTAFIFNFAHLSVVWIFSEVHGTSNVIIVPVESMKD